jgi:hypothetical protein
MRQFSAGAKQMIWGIGGVAPDPHPGSAWLGRFWRKPYRADP